MKSKYEKWGLIALIVLIAGITIFQLVKIIRQQIKWKKMLNKDGKFEVDRSLPRGIRNNNPGNLIMTSIPWNGKVPHEANTDGHFEQFYELKYGIRAKIKDLQSDIRKKPGQNTLQGLISAYAPPHENNTQAYINFMVDRTWITPWETLDASDKEQMKKIVLAIAEMENGGKFVTENDFEKAWEIV